MTNKVTLAPGVGATIYGDLPRDVTSEVVSACDFVCLHTAADPSDVQTAAKVRSLGCERVWMAIPANYLVRKGDRAAVAEVQRCAHIALDMGAELFELNGEGQQDGQKPGDWIPADETEAHRLAMLAGELLDAALDVLGDRCAVSWTSHDMPSFKLPWREILRRVDYAAHQHYPAELGRLVAQRELAARIARSQGRWEVLAERGEVPGNVVPYGDRWSPYLQGWGHQVGALVWGLCEAPLARLWAFPGSWSDAAVPALRKARAIRANTDVTKPDVIERFQQSAGIEADGIVGPRTLAAIAA